MMALRARRAELVTAVRAAGPDPDPAALDALAALAAIDDELHRAETRAPSGRLQSLVQIHGGLERLRASETPAAVIAAAPREICRSCGFTRTMISRVAGSRWIPTHLEIIEGVDADGGAAFARYVRDAEIPLAHMLLETELVRRRMPALVDDPGGNPRTFKELVGVSRSSSFVVAPIMPTGRVIGFLHADRFGEARPVDATDRDAIWLFAEHFGLIFERAVLVERLERQRSELRRAFAKVAARIDESCESELGLVEPESPLVSAGATAPTSASRLNALLTTREREVLELMVGGATNPVIAQQLVVSQATVKSHVKAILRKLRAANRSEAVARYLRLMAREHEAAL